MLHTERKPVKVCIFDLGNTLINDTQLTRDSIVDMGEWLFHRSLISSREALVNTFMRVNRETDKPFISHTFGEIEFFEKTFEELSINGISANDALCKYREILTEKIHPDSDIVDTFQLLKEKKSG